MTSPSALLFDFGGTLDADGVAWKGRFRALFASEGARPPAERFDRAFYDADDALVGAIPKTLSLSETVHRLSRGVAQALGENGNLADRVAERFLEDARARLSESAALLEELSSRFRLGVVSNFYGNLNAVCAETGVGRHLAAAIDSVDVGVGKPDPRIFTAALEAVGATADRTIFIGDSLPRDMEGARRAGMRHVWLQPGAAAACCPEDAVIERLARLPEVLP